jgi:hypothetical protein
MESNTQKKSSSVNTPLIIVVAGAQGHLGKLVCESLKLRAQNQSRPVQIRGLARKGGAHSGSVIPDSSGEKVSEQQLIIESVDYGNENDLKRVCTGAYCVVSALQGPKDVIVGIQSRLLKAAIAGNVKRFIPSDFSVDFNKLPEGANRNFDFRIQFHKAADSLIQQSKSTIKLTSVYQGAFTELLASGRFLFDFKKRQIAYFGSPDTIMEFTTWKNTAEFTAAAALDLNPVPRSLYIAGKLITPKEAQKVAKQVTGADFKLKRLMSVGMLSFMISVLKFFKPENNKPMPMWVGMQYAYCMAIGPTLPEHLDNERYQGIDWTGVEGVVSQTFNNANV